jgi:hypothetical protein
LEVRAGQTFLVCAEGEVNLSQGGQGMTPGSCTTLMGHAVIWNELDVAQLERAGCEAVGGDLRIEAGAIESLRGLAKLKRVGGDLVIRGNTALETLAGLEGLESVGGAVVLEDNIALTSLEALSGLGGGAGQDVTALVVRGNYSLNSLAGLEWARGVSQELVLESLEINSLMPLSGVTGAVRRVRVADTSGLSTLAGLGGITRVEVLELDGNQSLTSMDALAVQAVSERLVIRRNDLLAEIGGLSMLEEDLNANPPRFKTLGDVVVESNHALVDLSGFDDVQRMGALEVRHNGALTGMWTDYRGPDQVTRLVIEQNSALVNLTGLYTLTQAPVVEILDNDALQSVSMDGLTRVQTLRIEGNDAFTGQLGGFVSLTRIERLVLERNQALSSLSFLSSNLRVLGLLRVVGNQALPPCALDGLIAGGQGDPDARPPAVVEVWQNGLRFALCP